MPRLLLTALACAVALLVLDLVFLGVVLADFYTTQLGPLRAPAVRWDAALAFYAMYVAAIVVHGVIPAPTVAAASRRGAGMGFVAYATYELTNLAVIAGWPPALVPVDVAWGVVLTGTVAAVGRLVYGRLGPHDAEAASRR